MKIEISVITFLLGHFKQKPGMYLGRNHISLLSTFMTGYMISLTTNGFDLTTDPFCGKEDDTRAAIIQFNLEIKATDKYGNF
jgi:hypothetical protein